MISVLEHDSERSVEWGGLAGRLMPGIALLPGAGPSCGRRLMTSRVISWRPLLVFARVEGRTLGPTAASSRPGDAIGPAGVKAGALSRSESVVPGTSAWSF